jgi:hypothetical protein
VPRHARIPSALVKLREVMLFSEMVYLGCGTSVCRLDVAAVTSHASKASVGRSKQLDRYARVRLWVRLWVQPYGAHVEGGEYLMRMAPMLGALQLERQATSAFISLHPFLTASLKSSLRVHLLLFSISHRNSVLCSSCSQTLYSVQRSLRVA